MLESYTALAFTPIPEGTGCAELEPCAKVGLDDPAVAAMTDFHTTRPLCVSPFTDIDTALRCMKISQARMLLVTSPTGDLLGLVTADDIRGECPVEFPGDGVREPSTVDQVMQPRHTLRALRLSAITGAHVGDVLLTLRETDQQHVLVIDDYSFDGEIRGLFSSVEIGCRLGCSIAVFRHAETFTQLAMMLRTDAAPAAFKLSPEISRP